MGNKISAVTGVRSDRYHEPGNAINEVWVGDVEVISRMPFGDSDMNQAGWPKGGVPKIPWRNFIIPLKRNELGSLGCDNACMVQFYAMYTGANLVAATTVWMSLVYSRLWAGHLMQYACSTTSKRVLQRLSTTLLCLSIFLVVLGIAGAVLSVIGWSTMTSLANPHPWAIWAEVAVAMFLCFSFFVSIRNLVYVWKVQRILHWPCDLD